MFPRALPAVFDRLLGWADDALAGAEASGTDRGWREHPHRRELVPRRRYRAGAPAAPAVACLCAPARRRAPDRARGLDRAE